MSIKTGLWSRSRSCKESEDFGWTRSRIPNNTRSQSRIFCPTRDIHLDHFLHRTPRLGIPVEMVQFLLKLLLKQIFSCVPRCPLIVTAKLHPLSVKSRKFRKGRSWSRTFYLRLRNPVLKDSEPVDTTVGPDPDVNQLLVPTAEQADV